MSERLKWARYNSGFIAHPERGRPTRYCWLRPHTNSAGQENGGWTYVLCCDGRERTGTYSDRQAAADAANNDWPRFLADLSEEARVAKIEQVFIDLAKQLNGTTRSIEELKLQETNGTLLLRTIRVLEPGRVREAISAELFRRRTLGDGR